MKDKYNVVIDTNVLVSAILSKESDSPVVKVLNLLFANEIQLFYNDDIMNEYKDVLHRKKFNFDTSLIKYIIDTIEENGIKVIAKKIDIELMDEKDKPFYELVMDESIKDGKLITGNIRHFPSHTKIVTPREFIEIYESNKMKN